MFQRILFLVTVWIQFYRVGAVNCGAILTNSTGWFSSPDIDNSGEYEFGANCVWVIRVPDNKIIHIHFLEMDIEEGLMCGYDYLRIRDGNKKVGHYCGTTVPPDFISNARLVFVEFRSDFYINKKGFNATFARLDDPTCGYYTWSVAGKFGSFDTELHNDCTWVISQQKHVPTVQVYVGRLNIEESEGCVDGHLEIYNEETSLSKFCGSGPFSVVTSFYPTVYVKLHSDSFITTEFMLYYCSTDKNGEWGGIRAEMSGSFNATDVDYNGLYSHYANTVWSIVAREDYFLRLFLHNIHIQSGFNSCSGDKLSVYDGEFEPGTELETICGYDAPDRIFHSKTNVMYVHFITDGRGSGSGFNVTFTQIAKLPSTTVRNVFIGNSSHETGGSENLIGLTSDEQRETTPPTYLPGKALSSAGPTADIIMKTSVSTEESTDTTDRNNASTCRSFNFLFFAIVICLLVHVKYT